LKIPARAKHRKIRDIDALPPLSKILLDGGGAKAELRAGRTDDGDVDRRGIKVDPLVDPAQPAIRILQLPSLIIVFGKKADCRAKDQGDRERRQDRESKPGHGRLWPRNACCALQNVRFRLGSRRCRVRLRGHASAISFPIEALGIDLNERLRDVALPAKIIDCSSTMGPGILGIVINDRVAANRQLVVEVS
jgi:hypothetical protein